MMKLPATRLAVASVAAAAVTPAAATAPAAIRRTQLHDFHVAQGAKMVPFAGWALPVQYTGVFPEHDHTRKHASLFDVSHMGQVRFFGADREAFFEWVTPADVQALPMNKGRLSVILNEQGGIKDDLIVTRHEDHLYCVINAGRAVEDLTHFGQKVAEFQAQGKDVTMVFDDELSLVALQGPEAVKLMSRFAEDLETMPFMGRRKINVKGVEAHVSRCGYTGEDGFELSCANADAEALAAALCEQPECKPAGLGARDSLRIEAGLCLYGNEINETTGPTAAGLGFTITKKRMTEGGFIGHSVVSKIRANPSLEPVRRVGIVSTGPCAREGVAVSIDGVEVGSVTSGVPSPTLGKNIAHAYVPLAHAKPGTEVTLTVRNRKVKGEITKMPFVATNYFMPTAKK